MLQQEKSGNPEQAPFSGTEAGLFWADISFVFFCF
jgi:hypothetical protein